MKYILVLVALLFNNSGFVTELRAAPPSPIDTTYLSSPTFRNFKAFADSAFSMLDTNAITTGVLLNKGVYLIDPAWYRGGVHDSLVSRWNCVNLNSELYNTSVLKNRKLIRPDTLKKRIIVFQDSSLVPIVIVRAHYSLLNPTALHDSLIYVHNGKFYDVTGRMSSPYSNYSTFAAVASDQTMLSSDARFVIDSSLFYSSNTSDTLLRIEINFGDSLGWRTLSLDTQVHVTYSGQGIRTVQLRAIYSSDSMMSTFDMVIGNPNGSPSDASLPMSEPVSDNWYIQVDARVHPDGYPCYGGHCYAFGNAYIWKGCDSAIDSRVLHKPVLIIPGFNIESDPSPAGDVFKLFNQTPSWFEIHNDVGNYRSLAAELRNRGYDVIVLQFGDWETNNNWIENNIEVFKQCIRDINTKTNNSDDIIVLGASMGGVIARYGLAEMERDAPSQPHNVSLFVSYDAPHRGAYVPVSFQEALWFAYGIGGCLSDDLGIGDYVNRLESPAA